MLEKTIILDGFSKTYSMTGWRLGYGVMPLWLADAVDKLMVNSNSCTASFTQRAGLAALQGPQDAVDAMVAEFRRRRDAIVKGLNEIPGFRCAVPAGAFYVFPERHAAPGCRARELADMLLNEAGVAVPERHGVRQLRRRLPAIQLRQLAGEHPGSARIASARCPSAGRTHPFARRRTLWQVGAWLGRPCSGNPQRRSQRAPRPAHSAHRIAPRDSLRTIGFDFLSRRQSALQ